MYHFGICLSKTIKYLKTAEIRIGNRHFQYRSETSPLYRPPRCVRHIPGFETPLFVSYALLISSRSARNGLGSPPAGHNDPRDLHSSRRPCMTSSPVFGPRDWEGVFAVKECSGMYCLLSKVFILQRP